MSTSTFIDPKTEPRQAYDALLAGLLSMCAQDPMIPREDATPDLLPASNVAFRDSGFIALSAVADYETLPGQPWTITRGDTLVINTQANYGPGDTLLVTAINDEFVLIGMREDGSFCWMARIEDDYEPEDTLIVGVVVEVRKSRKPRQIAQDPLTLATAETFLLKRVLQELGSRDEDDWLPELLPAPLAVSRGESGAGALLQYPDAFAMVVTNDTFSAANRCGWKIQRGDVLVFTLQQEDLVADAIYLVLQGAELTLGDAQLCSLRDGTEMGPEAVIVARAVQHRPLGQIGGAQ